MTRQSLRAALLGAVAALASPALAAPPQPVGIAAAVLNDVTVANAAARQPRRVVLRQQVAMADQVATGQRSQLQVLLVDRSTFTIGANARLSIDRFVYDPATGRSLSASVARGAFRFMSGRANRGGSSTITTPVASIGIRGTIVDGIVGSDAIAIAQSESGMSGGRGADPQTASLIVLRGPGVRSQGNALPGAISVTAGGKTVSLDRPLLAVFVPRQGAQPIGPFSISLSGLARLQGLIFPSLAEWRQVTAPVGNVPYRDGRQGPQRSPRRSGGPYGGPNFDGPYNGGPEPGYGGVIPSIPSFPGSMTAPPARRPAPSAPATPAPTRTPTTVQPAPSQPSPAAEAPPASYTPPSEPTYAAPPSSSTQSIGTDAQQQPAPTAQYTSEESAPVTYSAPNDTAPPPTPQQTPAKLGK